AVIQRTTLPAIGELNAERPAQRDGAGRPPCLGLLRTPLPFHPSAAPSSPSVPTRGRTVPALTARPQTLPFTICTRSTRPCPTMRTTTTTTTTTPSRRA